ncbi:hypothetical protein GDO81_005313 [Engystomops pustulosus]|uniref:Uncharacterized protein n=1 Tax=Engystomops pustulosus TaxID=76066 RepID=A0AAV7CMD7_ENGPU|nr:hypothetical protein GDO81_005313 [Engystomops pustulosus]
MQHCVSMGCAHGYPNVPCCINTGLLLQGYTRMPRSPPTQPQLLPSGLTPLSLHRENTGNLMTFYHLPSRGSPVLELFRALGSFVVQL